MIKVPDGATSEVRAEHERLIEIENSLLTSLGPEKFTEIVDGAIDALIENSILGKSEPKDEVEQRNKDMSVAFLKELYRLDVVFLAAHWNVGG